MQVGHTAIIEQLYAQYVHLHVVGLEGRVGEGS